MTPHTTTTTTANETVTLRSRHPNYRWRGVQFENHMATVTPAQAEAASRDPFYGVGRDFWADLPVVVGGGKNAAPKLDDPKPLDAAELGKYRKDQLAAIAAERGVELAESDTKAQIIEKLLAPVAAA